MLMDKPYTDVRAFCKDHKLKILDTVYVKGGIRLMVQVPADIEVGDKVLAAGVRVLRTKPTKEEETNAGRG